MKRFFAFFIPALALAGCATTGLFTITDQMVKPKIDSQWAAMCSGIEAGAPICVWWCDDQRFEKKPGEQERVTNIADWIQGYIEQRLVQEHRYDVVTRMLLEKVFREQEFQNSGLVSDETKSHIGKILGAKYMVVPRITRLSTLNIQILTARPGESCISSIRLSGRIRRSAINE
ncbi:MAG: CsgG/HfaB family protein [Spirochaetales bacterium]|jgi:curli biogenesis system outer membrane secretion channel CsgG|nr:CsgG/HfaB family protein [Spirochaetales bacterium]